MENAQQAFAALRALTQKEQLAVSGGRMKQITAVPPISASPIRGGWITVGELPPSEGIGVILYPA